MVVVVVLLYPISELIDNVIFGSLGQKDLQFPSDTYTFWEILKIFDWDQYNYKYIKNKSNMLKKNIYFVLEGKELHNVAI